MKMKFKSMLAALLAVVITAMSLMPTALAAETTDLSAMFGEIPGMPDLTSAVTSGEYSYVLNTDNTASIVGYVGTGTAINIPAEIDGYKVTAIDSVWLEPFMDMLMQMMSGMGSLLGDASLGDPTLSTPSLDAMPGFMMATSITIPASVVRINTEFGPFAICMANTAFSVDAANPNYKAVNGVLYDKSGSTLLAYPPAKVGGSFTVPKGVKTIAMGAFVANVNLKALKLPTTLTTIADGACSMMTGLKSITIPKSVKTIGLSAFSECPVLKTVTIKNGVKTIQSGAFSMCPALKKITIPKSVKSIAADAFDGSDLATVFCYTNSKAHKVAKKNKVKFDLIDLTGLKTVKKKTYFYKNGKKAKNQWCKLTKKKVYRTNKKGVILKKKWVKVSKKWYYLNKNGVRVTDKKLTIKGKTYTFNKKGVCKNK